MPKAPSAFTFAPWALAALVALHRAATLAAFRTPATADAGALATPAPLRATSQTSPAGLAVALEARLKRNITAQVSAFGPEAAHTALEATIIASGNLRDPRKALGVVPSMFATTGVLLDVRVMPEFEGHHFEIASRQSKKSLARFIAQRLENSTVVTLQGAWGCYETHNVLMAAIRAQSTMGVRLALVPSHMYTSGVRAVSLRFVCARVHSIRKVRAAFRASARAYAGARATGTPVLAPSGDQPALLPARPRDSHTHSEGPLLASLDGNLARLTRGLAARLNRSQSSTARISAIGPKAAYRALKSTMAAIENLNLREKALGVVPSIAEGTDTVLLEVRLQPKLKAQNIDIASGIDTHPKSLASVIAQRLNNSNVVTVGATGARPTYTVLEAAVQAKKIMGNVTVALMPSFVIRKKHDGLLSYEIRFICIRA